MAPKLTIKFQHLNEVRRVTVGIPTFEQLAELVKSLFSVPLDKIKLSYMDSDGDKIGICSQLEWETVLQESPLPRINVETGVHSADSSFRNLTPATPNTDTSNGPVVAVKLVVESKYADYGITIDAEHLKKVEAKFHLTLQKYFEEHKIHPDNVPSMFKKSISFVHVSEKVVVVEVGVARFCKALFRKGLELVSFPATISEGKEIFLEISELLQHPAVFWALAYVELLLNNTTKAKEYLQIIFNFDEELWEGLESHDFFHTLRDAQKYTQLVQMFNELTEEVMRKNAQKKSEERKEELKNKWCFKVEILQNMGIVVGDEELEMLDRFHGNVDDFLDAHFD